MNSIRARICIALALVAAGCGNQPAVSSTTPSSNPPVSAPAPSASTGSSTTAATPPAAQPAAKAGSSTSEPHYHLDQAQPKLATVPLRIGTKSIDAELCTTLTQIATGLMYRPGIGTNDGMLFVFGAPNRRSFYMKNVDFDIGVAYIDDEGVIQEIVTLHKRNEEPVPSASDRIQFVLETAPDWFTRNGIGVGTLIRTEAGGLKETLARRAQLR